MASLRQVGAAGLLFAMAITACDSKTKDGESKQAPATSSPSAPKDVPLAEFEPVDTTSIRSRGVPGGTEGRFMARPAVVASPCGFHLVVAGTQASYTTLLVGRELAWSKEGTPLLLRLDGVTVDPGIIDAKAMGAQGALEPEPLLALTGQWESTWLRREVGDHLPVKDNASGRGHLEPHLAWRVWSAALGPGKLSADVEASSAIVATAAIDQRVLVLRALLDDDALALRALRRLVFAVDSIERHPGSLGRQSYLATLEKALSADPKCATIHDAHDAQLN